MADTKVSALTELTVPPDPTDELVLVDKSDTTMAASGTDKRIQFSNFFDWAEAGDLSTIEPDDAAAAGTSVEIARADHQHAIVAAVAGTIQPDDAAAEGAATSFARSDHKHAVDAAAASSITGANAEGSSTSFARADHNHALNSPAVRVTHGSNTTLTTAVDTFLSMDTERFDTDTMHFTSSANLTGTVAKTNASATLTGTTTTFTSQLSVGQVISVPGGATELRVVTAIASDTSLTVNGNFLNTSSGQTAARVTSPLVARTAGVYLITGNCQFASNATNKRQLGIYLNRTTGLTNGVIGLTSAQASASGVTPLAVSTIWKLAQWDFVELDAFQNSGGNLDVTSTANYSTELGMVYVGTG